MKKYDKLLLIEWWDSKGVSSHWEFKDEIRVEYPVHIYTIGWLEHDGRKSISLVQSKSKEQVCGRITIPKCSIIKQKYLNE